MIQPRRRRALVPSALVMALAGAAGIASHAIAQERTPVPPEDYGRFERLQGSSLSPQGRWHAVAISKVDKDSELRVRPVANPDSVVVVPFGSNPRWSDDGRWLAFSIGVSEDEREAMQKRNEPVRSTLGLLDLETGERTDVESVAEASFSGDGRFLAMKRYPPRGERDHDGVDLVVRNLATGEDVNFGNVSDFAWQDDDARLAMVVDAAGMAGNGLRLWDAASGTLRTLDAAAARYTGLAWREDGADVAVLRSVPEDAEDAEDAGGEEAWGDTAHVVVAFTGVDGGPTRHLLEPETAPAFPAGYRIVPWENLEWGDDGGRLFLGIQERTPAEACPAGAEGNEAGEAEGDGGEGETPDSAAAAADDGNGAECEEDDDPTVEIWHAADVDIVPTQKVRQGRDRQENLLSVWHLDENRFVQLEDELVETVQVVEGTDVAIGYDATPWERDRMFGPEFRDVYTVDLRTGERTLRVERVEQFFGLSGSASPGGRYFVWLADDEYRAHDLRTGETACITCGVEASFVDLEDDHTVEQKPPYGMAGWLEDDEAVLIYDEHDLWRVDPRGGGGERLTRGAEENVRHRIAVLDPDRFGEALDPDEPRYFVLYDDWREMWGYGRADELGDEVERLLWDEKRFAALTKADDAEVYAWRAEAFDDSPDVFVGGPRLDGRQITNTNPFQDEYLWGRAELVTYVNEWGDTLQGSLFHPAGYESGRRYPMITYIYETLSQGIHQYHVPDPEDYYDFQAWIQEGYFVFQPDIVYQDRDPGVSAVVNIEPAVRAVLETGMVDPERLGLIGHSWGGYQTTFFVTQSDLFAAAVAGAPLTNLYSMYLSVYWNSGGTDARIFEISQGRMEVPFWEDEDAYHRNSPVFHIENMETPLLMAQGTEDGAVDFNQGVEFYNAARRAGKPFVFLVYNDENHGFVKDPNQKDYHRRILEWFGHYLKGEPAPAWITEGVPYLEQPGGRR